MSLGKLAPAFCPAVHLLASTGDMRILCHTIPKTLSTKCGNSKVHDEEPSPSITACIFHTAHGNSAEGLALYLFKLLNYIYSTPTHKNPLS